MTERIDRLVAKLDALRQKDIQFAVFGASMHKYRLNPPVAPERLAAVEARIGQPLPADYREFITRIGDGGAGPFYGLLRLEDNQDQTVQDDVPFPYLPDAPLYLDDIPELDKAYDQRDAAYDAGDDVAEQAAWDALDSVVNGYYRQATSGIKFIADEGCAMFDVLVVNGPQAGTVWYFNFADQLGVLPIFRPGTRQPMSFADWYEYWLDLSLADPPATPTWIFDKPISALDHTEKTWSTASFAEKRSGS